jgi:hypothetical protein
MKKAILCILALAFCHLTSFSQGCLPEGITFTRQTQIDSFQVIYPNCTEIEGNVTIYGVNDITNLNALGNITAIGGGLTINDSYSLNNFSGLDNLQTIAGDVLIKNNINQSSFAGLENLTTIGGNFETYQYYNSTLTNFQGLNGLTTIGGYFFVHIYSVLENFSGLENLTSIGGFFRVADNTFHDFTGLENLATIGEKLDISGNQGLVNLNGLQGLSSIGTDLYINSCPRLSSLAGLINLTHIGRNINIYINDSLTSLHGIDNVAAGTIDYLAIYQNHMLSTCHVKSVCDYLAAPAGTVYILDNAPGCYNREEVEAACFSSVNENNPAALMLMPNPAAGFITVSVPALSGKKQIDVFNMRGVRMMEQRLETSRILINISALSRGLYFVKVHNEKEVQVAKFVKE